MSEMLKYSCGSKCAGKNCKIIVPYSEYDCMPANAKQQLCIFDNGQTKPWTREVIQEQQP